MGFKGFFALSPVIGLCCHRRLRIESANLTPESRRQDHTTSPSASMRPRQKHRSRPLHPVPTFVTIAKRPSVGRDGAEYGSYLGRLRSGKFFQTGLDWENQIDLLQQIRFYAQSASGLDFRCTPKAAKNRGVLINRA